MQESQHDAHYSSQDREVVHCFQVGYVEHHNMLEATSLRADTIQDLTQQLPTETSFIWLVRAHVHMHTHTQTQITDASNPVRKQLCTRVA